MKINTLFTHAIKKRPGRTRAVVLSGKADHTHYALTDDSLWEGGLGRAKQLIDGDWVGGL